MVYTNRFILCSMLWAFALCTGFAQDASPAAKEDAAIEREKMLRAADTVEVLSARLEKLETLLASLQKDLADVKTENSSLKDQLAQSETQRLKEREIIIAEVDKAVTKAKNDFSEKLASAAPAPAPIAETDKAEKNEKSEKTEKGYEHVVEKGQTLWLIAKAYQDKGVAVTADDIRRANNLKAQTSLQVGQKLFIPAKSSSTKSTS